MRRTSSSSSSSRRPAGGTCRPAAATAAAGGGADAGAGSSGAALAKLLAAARATGVLNLANRQLTQVPCGVYGGEGEAGSAVPWWEAVPLNKLDVSHNELEQLPEQLWLALAEGAITLLLGHNQLRRLSPSIGSLRSLKLLDVSHNKSLASLPDELALLPALASVACAGCGLSALPAGLGAQQPALSALNAADNALASLPQGLAAASSLVVLQLGHNAISELPGAMVASWRSLKELDVSHNKLQVLPDEVGALPCLARLDACSNQLAALPATLGASAALAELLVGFNALRELPPSLGLAAGLRVLDVRNNLLQELPEPLCGLSLVLLDVTNNSLRALPPALGAMTTLRSLPCDGNPLKLVRRELWSGPISKLLKHLRDQLPPEPCTQPAAPARSSATAAGAGASGGAQRLACSLQAAATSSAPVGASSAACGRALPCAGRSGGNSAAVAVSGSGECLLQGKGLTRVPCELWQAAAGLSKLDLSNNSLGAESFGALSGLPLKVLCLNACGLTAWPLAGVCAGGLEALHTLELRGNVFEALPRDGLAACPALRSLDLGGTRGLSLPAGFFEPVPQLEVFAAARAGLTTVPEPLLAASSLRQLQLAGNALRSLPVELTQLTRLQELDVRDNDLGSLPPQLGLMAGSLRVLLLEGNCIRTIRRQVLESGTPALLEYLRGRVPA